MSDLKTYTKLLAKYDLVFWKMDEKAVYARPKSDLPITEKTPYIKFWRQWRHKHAMALFEPGQSHEQLAESWDYKRLSGSTSSDGFAEIVREMLDRFWNSDIAKASVFQKKWSERGIVETGGEALDCLDEFSYEFGVLLQRFGLEGRAYVTRKE